MDKRGKTPNRPAHQVKERVYLSPRERQRIIRRRLGLLEELIRALVKHPGDMRHVDRLALKYSPAEVSLIAGIIERRAARSFISEEAAIYRSYRLAFARFGGHRRFLSAQEHDRLGLEHARLDAGRCSSKLPFRRPSPRERELVDLLLPAVDYWQDITPPAVPPRPDDFAAPPPGDYGYPARTLLKWGWDMDERRIADHAGNVARWRPAVPELIRMTLDEGFLRGWPGEGASWAPYHALRMLGGLHAHEAAGRLLALLEREDDWLSDLLPTVWAEMGPKAEPPLWSYLDDVRHHPRKRSLVFLGLAHIAEAHPECRAGIVAGFSRLLQRATAGDAEANGYLVYILNRMAAVETQVAIVEAFRQGKVDPEIMQPGDVAFLDKETLAEFYDLS